MAIFFFVFISLIAVSHFIIPPTHHRRIRGQVWFRNVLSNLVLLFLSSARASASSRCIFLIFVRHRMFEREENFHYFHIFTFLDTLHSFFLIWIQVRSCLIDLNGSVLK